MNFKDLLKSLSAFLHSTYSLGVGVWFSLRCVYTSLLTTYLKTALSRTPRVRSPLLTGTRLIFQIRPRYWNGFVPWLYLAFTQRHPDL